MTTETQQGASNVDIRAGNILSICSGIGGLDLGVHMASEDARTICYVEREAFAIASLVEAMEAGRLDQAPVWTDLRTFDGLAWRGVVDTIIGGIPCQPHSIAGLQRGEDDERDLWPDTARIIADIQPGRVFLENVSGIAPYYFERIGPDLRAMGYSTETGLFSASEVGASHQRQRFFILAHRDGELRELPRNARKNSDRGIQDVAHRDGGQHDEGVERDGGEFQRAGGEDGNGNVADAAGIVSERPQRGRDRGGQPETATGNRDCDVADADATRPQGRDIGRHGGGERAARTSSPPLFAPFRNDTAGWSRLLSSMPQAEPAFCGASHGSSNGVFLNEDRVDRLRSLGNMVVPLTGALAFTHLTHQAGLHDGCQR